MKYLVRVCPAPTLLPSSRTDPRSRGCARGSLPRQCRPCSGNIILPSEGISPSLCPGHLFAANLHSACTSPMSSLCNDLPCIQIDGRFFPLEGKPQGSAPGVKKEGGTTPWRGCPDPKIPLIESCFQAHFFHVELSAGKESQTGSQDDRRPLLMQGAGVATTARAPPRSHLPA